MTTTRKPLYIAYAVTGEGDKTFWNRIGAAWLHGNGDGLTVELDAFPVHGRIVLRTPRSETSSEGSDAS